jgi:hypothetical protein
MADAARIEGARASEETAALTGAVAACHVTPEPLSVRRPARVLYRWLGRTSVRLDL